MVITATITGSSYRAECFFVLGLMLLSCFAEGGRKTNIGHHRSSHKNARRHPSENALPENALPENTLPENAPTENASPENASPENVSAENASPENVSAENASSDNASAENVSAENASTENAPRGISEVFNVLDHGAVGDGKTNNVQAFMQVWNKACKSPGQKPAKLFVPKGTFVTGPVIFQGPCTASKTIIVEVLGTIQATSDISEYSDPEWFAFENMNNLELYGGGTFDGQGASSWKYNNCQGSSSDCQILPTSIKFKKVNNSAFHGITSLNSKGFHLSLLYCENFNAYDLQIVAPEDSPNTDGMHISSSHFVNVSNSVIGTGDDCIGIVQGTTNVAITGVTCGPGHGFSIGSLGKYPDEADVGRIVVRNCTARNTSNGVRIKTMTASPPSRASDITFEDIIMDGVNNPIVIDQMYGSHGKTEKKPSQVQISDVHFRNIRGTSRRAEAISLQCSASAPCVGLELVGIDLVYQGAETPSVTCLNAKQVTVSETRNPSSIPCH